MTSPDDVPPLKPPPSFSPATSILPSKSRYTENFQNSQPLIHSLSESSFNRRSLPDLQSVAAPETTSRSSSPDHRLSRSTLRLSRSSTTTPTGSQTDGSDDVRSIIIRAFSPTIGVCSSPDTDALIQQKGFKRGFLELIRPFGERITGKIVIRDGVGSSRSWDDLGVRFAELTSQESVSEARDDVPVALQLEQVLEKHLEPGDQPLGSWIHNKDPSLRSTSPPSPLYKLFLRRLLSSASPTPHETFDHPVACVIAISSHTPTPLESLRQLYARTSQGDMKPAPWVQPEYLRYYVLVHDEDRDDIAQSTALFDQMKRHFGLHCHLLRLRSNQCVVTDDDSTPFPTPEWLSPLEDLVSLGKQESLIDVETEPLYLFESDVTAIKSFIREFVAQSVIPHMENRVALWNDQVASRRRGLSGRFMSISKRWAGFGSTPRSSGSPFGGGSSNNYDPFQGFYPPDSPEATLRKMADYAFMLRDWKLAASTYDLLRTDFGNDKAWKYHAGAHEMCAVATLLNPLLSTSKSKLEPIEQLLETACYSYLTRCSDPQYTLRTIVLGAELLKSRGGTAAEIAAKWSTRVLDMGLVGSIGRLLLLERVSACFASKMATNGTRWGTRRRKAGMWALLAAEGWLEQGQPGLASNCLEEADRQYSDTVEDGIFPLPEMQQVVDDLRHAVKIGCLEALGMNGEGVETPTETGTEETREKLDYRGHSHRKSLMGAANPLEGVPHVPLRPLDLDETAAANDDFE
ncbi:hypothetical protein PRK78_006695 [Emydomyces testavorans]|uniref:ER-golgi trafficking TRAPP I complex 85 kDa subunit-domain-containing protein n=1 Tax=Emydomyces testavorans TaxID=2070801 RepID=A0AAF0DQN5_9EURO|nr:hypothetical protein PRK78_006695 [Emydomyces testavorans]